MNSLRNDFQVPFSSQQILIKKTENECISERERDSQRVILWRSFFILHQRTYIMQGILQYLLLLEDKQSFWLK